MPTRSSSMLFGASLVMGAVVMWSPAFAWFRADVGRTAKALWGASAKRASREARHEAGVREAVDRMVSEGGHA